MNIKTQFPNFLSVVYDFNPETSHYQKSTKQLSPYPIPALPFELMREAARAEQIKRNVKEVLTIRGKRKSNGSKTILTGLEQVNNQSLWYLGNKLNGVFNGKKSVSDILFYFYPDNSKMIAFYFANYHRYNIELKSIYPRVIIPRLEKEFGL